MLSFLEEIMLVSSQWEPITTELNNMERTIVNIK